MRNDGQGPSQAELQEQEQVDSGPQGVGAPMEVTLAVEPFDGKGCWTARSSIGRAVSSVVGERAIAFGF